MVAGDARLMHDNLQTFAKYGAFDVDLGGHSVVIHHTQFAQYPIERAVNAVYDGLSPTIDDYDGFESMYMDVADQLREDIETAVEAAQGVTVDLHDRRHFNPRAFIDPSELSHALTTLFRLQTKEDTGRYEVAPSPVESNAELVARLFSVYHLSEATGEVLSISEGMVGTDVSGERGSQFVFAARDVVEREHGWTVFEEPQPSQETVDDLWAVVDEFDEITPEVELMYGIFVMQKSAMDFAPDDVVDRKMHSALAQVERAVLSFGDSEPQYEKYFAESTSEDVREAYREGELPEQS